MKFNRINIGELIQKKVEEKKITPAQFAKCIGMQRQNVKKMIFEKHGLDTDMLITICEVLEFNFFSYYKTNDDCNKNDYMNHGIKEVKASITLEVGQEKKEQMFYFTFGKDDLNK